MEIPVKNLAEGCDKIKISVLQQKKIDISAKDAMIFFRQIRN